MFLIKREDTEKHISNLNDQLKSFGADISSLQDSVGDVLLHLEGNLSVSRM
jgi:peptidoglycan hydrolase CwlO-like protein